MCIRVDIKLVLNGFVAQLVEHLPEEQSVEGSIPSESTSFKEVLVFDSWSDLLTL